MTRFVAFLALGVLLTFSLSAPSSGQVREFFQDLTEPQQPYHHQPYQQPRPQDQGRWLTSRVGSAVYDSNGNNVGTLTDVVADPRTGQALYGILSSGGILGFGATERPVPAQLFGMASRNRVTLGLTQDHLRSAPDYTAGNRPDLFHPSWQRRISSFYGIQPYGAGQGYGGSQGQDAYVYQNLFNPRAIQRIDGTVERVWRRAQGDLVQVALRGNDERIYMVVLAPEWYLRDFRAIPRVGDQITVTGSLVSHEGRTFLIATRLRSENQTVRIRSRDGQPNWVEQNTQPNWQGRY